MKKTTITPAEHQHQARKRFGQNFLIDDDILDRLDAAVGARPDDHLVEIGPGLGALTARLLQRAARLDAIELDRDLVAILQQKFAGAEALRIHQADALAFDFGNLATADGIRVIGNLPYNISTPLMFHLLEAKDRLIDMTFMLQREVVERLAAQPGAKAYGRLSIMCQYHCQVVPLFDVPPEAFRPAPKVHSAVVRLVPRAAPQVRAHDEALLAELVRNLFQMRRKTLRNGLKLMLSNREIELLQTATELRPEALSVTDFVNLANAIFELRNPHD